MDDEIFLKDLILLSGEPCHNFCRDILNRSIIVDESYKNYVFLTLILLRYLDID